MYSSCLVVVKFCTLLPFSVGYLDGMNVDELCDVFHTADYRKQNFGISSLFGKRVRGSRRRKQGQCCWIKCCFWCCCCFPLTYYMYVKSILVVWFECWFLVTEVDGSNSGSSMLFP